MPIAAEGSGRDCVPQPIHPAHIWATILHVPCGCWLALFLNYCSETLLVLFLSLDISLVRGAARMGSDQAAELRELVSRALDASSALPDAQAEVKFG